MDVEEEKRLRCRCRKRAKRETPESRYPSLTTRARKREKLTAKYLAAELQKGSPLKRPFQSPSKAGVTTPVKLGEKKKKEKKRQKKVELDKPQSDGQQSVSDEEEDDNYVQRY